MILQMVSGLLCLFLHLSSTTTFPPPLSKEEEDRYFKAMKGGNSRAREILIERNRRLVAHIAKKYAFGQSDADDIMSIGTIGLIKAIDSFRPECGVRFATYAVRCLQNATLSQMRLWFRTNPPRAEKNQNGVFWHRLQRIYTSFAPLRMVM